MSCYYLILGISKNATLDEIKKAHRHLVLKNHPDKISNNLSEIEKNIYINKFIEINKAYDTLKDNDKRKIYDLNGINGLEEYERKKNHIDEINEARERNKLKKNERELRKQQKEKEKKIKEEEEFRKNQDDEKRKITSEEALEIMMKEFENEDSDYLNLFQTALWENG